MDINKEWLIGKLQKFSPKQIANMIGCHPETIRKKMRLFNIKRSRHAHLINENFFSKWSYDMSYILGFTFADGSINTTKHHNKLCFQLHTKDIEILEFIISRIQPNRNIYRYERVDSRSNKIYGYVMTDFSSKKIIDDLHSLGCIKNKTYCGIRLPNIPSKFLGSFIRGLFDGDGCITNGRADIVCSSVDFLNDIRQAIGFGKVCLSNKPPRICFYSKNDRQKLFNLIYDDGFRLERKYVKYKEIMNG